MVASLRSQRQASTTFDLGGATAPRPKGAFYVYFNVADCSQGIPAWLRNLGFLVKTTTNPLITPKVEEINQYNKKRQVYTGYTFSPVTITLYDTADSTALRMWNEYASYYFSDFNHSLDDYRYDMVPQAGQSSMLGDALGYGYQPRAPQGNATDPLDTNSQFFFETIEVYQVFRNAYTMYSLVNPKITSWETEELDYEQFSPVMHHLQITYEAVLYENNGAPTLLSQNAELAALFSDIRLSGDFIDVQGAQATDVSSSGVSIPNQSAPNLFGGTGSALAGLTGVGAGSLRSGLGGVLNNFGNFNFGAALGTAAKASGITNSLSQLTYSMSNNPALAQALNIVSTAGQQTTSAVGALTVGQNPNGISTATYDAARAAVSSASGSISGTDMGASVVSGVMAMSAMTGQNMSSALSNQGGFQMASPIYGVVNQSRSAMSQIGFNDQSSDQTFAGNPNLSATVDPPTPVDL